MEISEIKNYKLIPIELLLLADPELDHLEKYIDKSFIYVAVEDKSIVGAIAILKTNNNTYEIMNISVFEKYQKKGIGKNLIKIALERAKKDKIRKVIIGTGNTSINQIIFYQKLGFRITKIIKNYFIKNYKNKIFENGSQCKDMICLEILI